MNIRQIKPIPNVTVTTGDKPQSKVWYYDQRWWAVIADEVATYVWRLDPYGQDGYDFRWTKTLKISKSQYNKPDCKSQGQDVFVLLHNYRYGSKGKLICLRYNSQNNRYAFRYRKRKYVRLGSILSKTGTATIELDGDQRLWLAYDTFDRSIGQSVIQVRSSKPPYKKFSGAEALGAVNGEDLCSVARMDSEVGVMWSDQRAKKNTRFGFRIRKKEKAGYSWRGDELAKLKGTNIRKRLGDNHINVVVARTGRMYAAVKTSYDKKDQTKIGLLIRQENGKWVKQLFGVSNTGSRPIVVLDEEKNRVHVIFMVSEKGGNILYKSSPVNSIGFSVGPRVLMNGKYKNPTSAKSWYRNQVVVLAYNKRTKAVDGVLCG